MFYEDLHDVILVGHSYAGTVITGVAGQAPERLAGLVYFDSYVPQPGEALHTIGGKAPSRTEPPPGGLSPAPPGVAERLGINDPDLAAWTDARLVPHPYRAFIEPVQYDPTIFQALPRAFVACKNKPNPGTSAPFAEMAKANPEWHYRELWAGHDAMITAPRETADVLIELAQVATGAISAESGSRG
jgi:pimeloyl-ACP methyl ester carboxylesterase